MTAKEYLKQYEDAESLVASLMKEYKEEELMIDAIRSSTNFNEMPFTKTSGKNPVLDKVIRLEKKWRDLLAVKAKAIETRQMVFETICLVHGDERTVLVKRYIELKRWEQIAVEMNYSWSGIHKLHRRALHIVDGIISE